MSTNKSETPAQGEYSHQQILTIMVGLMLGMFLASLDQTVVGTAMRTIADDLHGLSAQAWVTTAYLITSTVTTPIYGKLGDLFGRKSLFLFAITVFVIGSLLCTLPQDMYQLAAARAVQGLGAGGLFTLVLAIVGDIVPPLERARYSGYFMSQFAISSILGPVVGGLLAGADSILGIAGWRWIFLVNVPLGILALVVVTRTLHLHRVKHEEKPHVDWSGAVALVLCLVPFLLVAERGREWGWGSAASVVSMVVAAVALVVFLLIERAKGPDALIPFGLFRIKAAAVVAGGNVLVGAAMFGSMMLIPLYLQIVKGYSPMESGWLMLPMVVGVMGAGLLSGRVIPRTGKIRPFPLIGMAMAAAAMLGLSLISADTHLWVFMVLMFFAGHGIGYCMQPPMIAIQSAVPPHSIGVATSTATFTRQIGGTLAVAVLLALLFATVTGNIVDEFAKVKDDPAFASTVQGILDKGDDGSLDYAIASGDQGALAGLTSDSSGINTIDPVLAHPIKEGFADSMSSVFLWTAGISVVAFLVFLLMPHVELRRRSPQAERAADEAAAAE